MFKEILQEILRYDKIIIHRHSNPDGDALGSQIGLRLIIEENFPEKKVYTVGDHAKRYSFMARSKMDEIEDSVYEGALAIILDTSAKSLISDDRYTLAARTVRMDHHIFCEKIADVELTDTSFESCAGLIAAFAKESGLRLPAWQLWDTPSVFCVFRNFSIWRKSEAIPATVSVERPKIHSAYQKRNFMTSFSHIWMKFCRCSPQKSSMQDWMSFGTSTSANSAKLKSKHSMMKNSCFWNTLKKFTII